MKNTYDILILGGGPAGLTAAIYTSRASIKTLVLAGNPPGGQLTTTTDVENFPGFPKAIEGSELIQRCREQAHRFGTVFVDDNVTTISGSPEQGFTVVTEGKKEFTGKVVILAMGASAKWLGLESETLLRGKGVSACATCDGFFFKDKVVAVVGGGDAAMEEALFMTKFSPKVYVLVRGAEKDMKASKFMRKRAVEHKNIEFLFNTEVKEVLGEKAVAGIQVLNNITNQTSVMEDVEGLFIAIGHKPNTDFLQEFVELGKFGYINATDTTKTSKEGVFVAGDAADYKYRQAVTAAGYGCMAALDAERYIGEHFA